MYDGLIQKASNFSTHRGFKEMTKPTKQQMTQWIIEGASFIPRKFGLCEDCKRTIFLGSRCGYCGCKDNTVTWWNMKTPDELEDSEK